MAESPCRAGKEARGKMVVCRATIYMRVVALCSWLVTKPVAFFFIFFFPFSCSLQPVRPLPPSFLSCGDPDGFDGTRGRWDVLSPLPMVGRSGGWYYSPFMFCLLFFSYSSDD